MSALLAWVATGFKALRTSRVPCMALLFGSFFVERTINSHLEPEMAITSSLTTRCLLTLTLSGTLLYRRGTYVNHAEESNRLLKRLIEAEKTPAWFHKYKPSPTLPVPRLLFHEPPSSTQSTSNSTCRQPPLMTPLKRARATATGSYLNSA